MPRLHLVSKKYSTVLVEGESMLPTYAPGDWLMAHWGNYALKSDGFSLGNIFGDRVKVGDVVVIERPEYPGIFYIKRITDVRHEANQIYVSSDNPEGTDSREWGWLPAVSVQAKILSRVRKKK
jgi:phage repressor protein C with HTH and peptisase S24 domain